MSGLALAGLIFAVNFWWALIRLPDVGDPFDLEAALRSAPVAPGENAFTLYRVASAKLGRSSNPQEDVLDWEGASPTLRAYLASNREALDLWREGTERPEAIYYQTGEATLATILPVIQDLMMLARLGLLEGARLEASGDMAGAWGWYRAALRSSRHAAMAGFLVERQIGAAIHGRACDRLTRWAADPRVDAGLLRRALDDVAAIDAMTPPLSESLKREYFIRLRDLDEMNILVEDLPPPVGDPNWYRQRPIANKGLGYVQRARVSLENDRERSRRVLRLVFANWLAQVDKPARLRARVATRQPVMLYEADPSAPPAARALPPEDLAREVGRTLLAREAMKVILERPSWEADGILARERSRQAALVVTLAEQLYRREHGRPPSDVGELVGPYLEAIPEDYAPTARPNPK
jgi:hypothetical protein